MRRSRRAMRMALAAWLLASLVVLSVGCCRSQPTQVGQGGNGNKAPGEVTDRTTIPLNSGAQLYQRHCAACHGEKGDGNGIAASYLYPKPRDFQAGRFRLVSTVNRTPSRDDLLGVLKRGMPGSAMPPWDHLGDDELDVLVDEVQRLHQEGVRNEYVRVLVEEEELTAEEIQDPAVQEEIQAHVKQRTTAGETTQVPAIAAADAQAIAHGKEIYMRQGCNKCHGDQGRGDGGQKMVDDEGFPMTPRDFTQGIFKGGHDPASIYGRIAYGMPGTPMPSSQLQPDEIGDLAHFVLSLSDEQARQNALQKRRQVFVSRVANLPADDTHDAWASIESTPMRIVPLWWRDDGFSTIQVKALHDGQTLALQLSWQDETHDMHAATSSNFEDAVAVELYQGNKEPFLGMGGPDSPVDVWFWDADRQSPIDVEDQYPNAVVDIYPFHEKQVDTAEYQREGTKLQNQPKVSMPALATGNQIAPRSAPTGGSSLSVGGPGSVTFRMPKNQAVDARGTWADGRWTVVMKRTFQTASADGGVSLSPGDRASIAFAVWNGAKNDRDGQKLITIWNDLVLEK